MSKPVAMLLAMVSILGSIPMSNPRRKRSTKMSFTGEEHEILSGLTGKAKKRFLRALKARRS